MLFIVLAITNKGYNNSVFGLVRQQEELGDLGWDVILFCFLLSLIQAKGMRTGAHK